MGSRAAQEGNRKTKACAFERGRDVTEVHGNSVREQTLGTAKRTGTFGGSMSKMQPTL